MSFIEKEELKLELIMIFSWFKGYLAKIALLVIWINIKYQRY